MISPEQQTALDCELYEKAKDNNVPGVIDALKAGARLNGCNEGFKNTALHCATNSDGIETAHFLIQQGADINPQNKAGNTPLHCACFSGYPDMAEMLLTAGADVNSKNNEERTPLHWTTLDNHHKTTKILLESGADIDAVDGKGNTPLHYATINSDHENVNLLLAAGADVTIKNNEGYTPAEQITEDDMTITHEHFRIAERLKSIESGINARRPTPEEVGLDIQKREAAIANPRCIRSRGKYVIGIELQRKTALENGQGI